MLLTQPTLFHKDMPPELEDILYQWSMPLDAKSAADYTAYSPEALETIMESYNRVLKDVCRERDVACIDLAAMLPKDETVYYSDCHFNNSGCAKIAAILRDDLCGK